MNREIKFRGWDKEQGKMLSHEDIDKLDIDGVVHWMDIIKPDNKDGIQVMQYTGLKDKNGKEIYEGDICQRFHLKGQVVYDSERAIFIIMDGFNEPLYSEIYGVEVIGNIYENNELLNQ